MTATSFSQNINKNKPNIVYIMVSATIDMMPTICELLHVDAPKGINGISLLPQILDKKQEEHTIICTTNFLNIAGSRRCE